MNSRPILWHIEISHYNEKARWALELKGVGHERAALVLEALQVERPSRFLVVVRDLDVPEDRAGVHLRLRKEDIVARAYAGSGRSRSTSSSVGRPSNRGMTSDR